MLGFASAILSVQQSNLQYVRHVLGDDPVEFPAQRLRDFIQVLFISIGYNDGLDPGAEGCQALFLQAADG